MTCRRHVLRTPRRRAPRPPPESYQADISNRNPSGLFACKCPPWYGQPGRLLLIKAKGSILSGYFRLERGADAAVDPEGDAGEPLGLIGGEIDGGVGDIVRLAEPPQEVHLHEGLVLPRLLERRQHLAVEVGLDVGGTDGIDAHALRRVVHRHVLGQDDHHAALGRAVRRVVRRPTQAGHGGDVDDVPLAAVSSGRACREQRKALVTLASRVARNPSSLRVRTAPRCAMPPALLTSTSRRPNASSAVATRRATSAARVTSAGHARATPPACVISAMVFSIGSARRPASTTLAPSRPNMRAMARPRPVPAPVTMATLSLSRIHASSRGGVLGERPLRSALGELQAKRPRCSSRGEILPKRPRRCLTWRDAGA